MSSDPPPIAAPQTFGPTSGVVSGWIGVITGTAVAAWLVIDRPSSDAVRAALLVAAAVVLCWSFLLRPRVRLREDELELRNALSDWHIPLAAVEGIVVRQATVVLAGGRRLVGIGVGVPLRKLVRRRLGSEFERGIEAPEPAVGHPALQLTDVMVERIQWAAREARRSGAEAGSPTRTWAVPELVVLAVLLIGAVVVSFV